jgi:UDP-galactopyranose mutase
MERKIMNSERRRSGSTTTRKLRGQPTKREQASDIVCLSHLRWGFVYQRPQHLMSRFAKSKRVFFFEEPVVSHGYPWLEMKQCPETGVRILTPHIPPGTTPEQAEVLQEEFLFQAIAGHRIRDYVLWYYTPMALGFSRSLSPRLTVYDCMDELSAFRGAPPQLVDRERELFERAEVVFTGGRTLYEAKRHQHWNIHAFPSSVEVAHFAKGRTEVADPDDQAHIPRPRFGYCGVIDERMDLELLDSLAERRPNWHFVMLGPVVKIEQELLPVRRNIHYLGGKAYQQLPAYLASWDIAMLPFARNESTRFISPTKTPEYLAAGRPVISTSIRDVVTPYGDLGLATIADSADEFIRGAESYLAGDLNYSDWLTRVDAFLAETSWDATWARMNDLIELGIKARSGAAASGASLVGMSAASEYGSQPAAGD